MRLVASCDGPRCNTISSADGSESDCSVVYDLNGTLSGVRLSGFPFERCLVLCRSVCTVEMRRMPSHDLSFKRRYDLCLWSPWNGRGNAMQDLCRFLRKGGGRRRDRRAPKVSFGLSVRRCDLIGPENGWRCLCSRCRCKNRTMRAHVVAACRSSDIYAINVTRLVLPI